VATNLETRSIAELERINWRGPDPDASLLARRCYELIRKPLSNLTVADWRVLIAQDIGLNFLMVRAIEVVEKDPLLETEHYRGDLLVSMLRVSPEFFSRHPAFRSRLEKVIDSLPAALDQLDFINFDTSSEALEEAIAEFRNQ
jgi:hypothetical protein